MMMGKSNISYDAQRGCKKLGEFGKKEEKKVEEEVL
jgi:hypothetical protein